MQNILVGSSHLIWNKSQRSWYVPPLLEWLCLISSSATLSIFHSVPDTRVLGTFFWQVKYASASGHLLLKFLLPWLFPINMCKICSLIVFRFLLNCQHLFKGLLINQLLKPATTSFLALYFLVTLLSLSDMAAIWLNFYCLSFFLECKLYDGRDFWLPWLQHIEHHLVLKRCLVNIWISECMIQLDGHPNVICIAFQKVWNKSVI